MLFLGGHAVFDDGSLSDAAPQHHHVVVVMGLDPLHPQSSAGASGSEKARRVVLITVLLVNVVVESPPADLDAPEAVSARAGSSRSSTVARPLRLELQILDAGSPSDRKPVRQEHLQGLEGAFVPHHAALQLSPSSEEFGLPNSPAAGKRGVFHSVVALQQAANRFTEHPQAGTPSVHLER